MGAKRIRIFSPMEPTEDIISSVATAPVANSVTVPCLATFRGIAHESVPTPMASVAATTSREPFAIAPMAVEMIRPGGDRPLPVATSMTSATSEKMPAVQVRVPMLSAPESSDTTRETRSQPISFIPPATAATQPIPAVLDRFRESSTAAPARPSTKRVTLPTQGRGRAMPIALGPPGSLPVTYTATYKSYDTRAEHICFTAASDSHHHPSSDTRTSPQAAATASTDSHVRREQASDPTMPDARPKSTHTSFVPNQVKRKKQAAARSPKKMSVIVPNVVVPNKSSSLADIPPSDVGVGAARQPCEFGASVVVVPSEMCVSAVSQSAEAVFVMPFRAASPLLDQAGEGAAAKDVDAQTHLLMTPLSANSPSNELVDPPTATTNIMAKDLALGMQVAFTVMRISAQMTPETSPLMVGQLEHASCLFNQSNSNSRKERL